MNEKQEDYLIHKIAIALANHCNAPFLELDRIEHEIKTEFKRLGDE